MRHAPADCGWRVWRGSMLADGGPHSAQTAVHQRMTGIQTRWRTAHKDLAVPEDVQIMHEDQRAPMDCPACHDTSSHDLLPNPSPPSPHLPCILPLIPLPHPAYLPSHLRIHRSACACAGTSVHMCLSVHACMHAHTRALPILPGVLPHASTARYHLIFVHCSRAIFGKRVRECHS